MDPGHAAPFPTPAPGLQTSAGDGGKPYLSLRLLTAFSILPLSYERGGVSFVFNSAAGL